MVTTFVYIQWFILPKTTDTYQYLRIQTFIHQNKLKKKAKFTKRTIQRQKKNIFNSMLIRLSNVECHRIKLHVFLHIVINTNDIF